MILLNISCVNDARGLARYSFCSLILIHSCSNSLGALSLNQRLRKFGFRAKYLATFLRTDQLDDFAMMMMLFVEHCPMFYTFFDVTKSKSR